MFETIWRHEEHYDVCFYTANLKAEAAARHRDHRRRTKRPLPTILLARHGSAAKRAADSESGLLKARNHGDTFRFLQKVFRNTRVWSLDQLLHDFRSLPKPIGDLVVDKQHCSNHEKYSHISSPGKWG